MNGEWVCGAYDASGRSFAGGYEGAPSQAVGEESGGR